MSDPERSPDAPKPPTEIAASGPAVTLEAAGERVGGEVKSFGIPEEASNDVRGEPPRQPGEPDHLVSLQVAAEGVAIDACSAEVEPSQPFARRDPFTRRTRRRPALAGRIAITERRKSVVDTIGATIGRVHETLDVVLAVEAALLRAAVDVVGEARAIGREPSRNPVAETDFDRVLDRSRYSLARRLRRNLGAHDLQIAQFGAIGRDIDGLDQRRRGHGVVAGVAIVRRGDRMCAGGERRRDECRNATDDIARSQRRCSVLERDGAGGRSDT